MRKTAKWILVAVVGLLVTTMAPARAQEAGEPEVVVPADVPTDARPLAGAFNGASSDTIFWYSSSEVDRRWQGKDNRTFAEMEPTLAGADYAPFTGDFNGDRRADIFLYGPGSRTDAIWYGRTDNAFDQVAATQAGTFNAVLPGDFNGDGRTDIVWYKPGGTVLWKALAAGGFAAPTSMNVTNPYKPFVGDFNGDRRDDIFWYRPGPEPDPIWYGKPDFSFARDTESVGGTYVPLVGDWDGNGRTDVFWYLAGTGQDYVWFSGAAGFSSVMFKANGTYKPFSGDFNGDGRGDIFWWGPGPAKDVTWFGGANRLFQAGPDIDA